jgi:hypothetical protein
MLAHDRRVLDVPLEERLQSRTSELMACAKTMLPVINRSVRDARAHLQTGHQDIRSYFSSTTVAATDHAATIPTATSPARPNVLLLDIVIVRENCRMIDLQSRSCKLVAVYVARDLRTSTSLLKTN